jgi:MSHA biogenesis protein MshK
VSSSHPEHRRLAIVALGLAALAGAAFAGVPNPMRPPGHLSPGAPAAPTWKLEAVLTAEGRRLAVIDGRLVRTGSTIAGARVLRIGRTSVVLRQGQRILLLHVFPSVSSAFRPLAPGASAR